MFHINLKRSDQGRGETNCFAQSVMAICFTFQPHCSNFFFLVNQNFHELKSLQISGNQHSDKALFKILELKFLS